MPSDAVDCRRKKKKKVVKLLKSVANDISSPRIETPSSPVRINNKKTLVKFETRPNPIKTAVALLVTSEMRSRTDLYPYIWFQNNCGEGAVAEIRLKLR
jgi:hypothetical protein